jgi:hypothetical protein
MSETINRRFATVTAKEQIGDHECTRMEDVLVFDNETRALLGVDGCEIPIGSIVEIVLANNRYRSLIGIVSAACLGCSQLSTCRYGAKDLNNVFAKNPNLAYLRQ